MTRKLATAVAVATALSLAGPGLAKPHLPTKPPPVVFADFMASSAKTNITWSNDIVPAVYQTIPAVTKIIPAVTETIPAVYKTIPAVTKIVNGKVVVVTPAKTVLVTPAKTVIIKPAQTIIVTPAQKILVSPAHDGPSGSLFSTTATKATAYGLAQTYFQFLIYPLAQLGMIPAQFSLQATSPAVDPATPIGPSLGEPGLTGTFAFTYDGAKPLKVWDTVYLPGANLLSGKLGGFLFDGGKGGGSGAILGGTELGEQVDYTSDFLDFSHTWQRDLSWYFLSGGKFQADSGAALHTISGNAGGSFASAARPIPTAVPEPAAWVLMVGGLLLAGRGLRRRRAPACA